MTGQADSTTATGPAAMADETAGTAPNALQGIAGISSPAEFEQQHRTLMELQGSGQNQEKLIAPAIDFVTAGRHIGKIVEDDRSRQHYQSVLDYWALAVYRHSHKEVDSDLEPFDHERAPTFDDDAFPYHFDAPWDGDFEKLEGWRRLLDECERDLAADRLLLVIGDVGSGIRTLVHAYLLPLLQKGAARLNPFSASDQWEYYQIRLGQSPLRDLVGSIAAHQGQGEQWIEQQVVELRGNPSALRRILISYSERPGLLVFDCFASILETSAEQRDAICRNMAELLQDPHQRFYAIATLRRGRSAELSKFGPLEKPLRDGHVLMGLTAPELRKLIEAPARRLGLVFEPGVIDHLVLDIQGEPTALPLLEFTLRRLWERRERNRITQNAYEITGAGTTALRIAMEEIHERLSSEEQDALRSVILQMVKISADGIFLPRPVPQRALLQTASSSADGVLQRLKKMGLVDEFSADGETMLLLSQPALLVSWPPLIQWLDELRLRNHTRLRLQQAAVAWTSSNRPGDLLWRKFQLEQAEHHLSAADLLDDAERQFLAASHRAERNRRLRRHAAALLAVAALIALVVLPLLAQRRAERSQQQYDNALESLARGDVTAALLWLDARNRSWLSSNWLTILGRSDEVAPQAVTEMMRQLAWMQAPKLELLQTVDDLTVSGKQTPVRSHGNASKFDALVVLPQRYMATVESEPVGQQREFKLRVRPLLETGAGKTSEPLALGRSQTPPAIALTSIGPPASNRAYVLALQPSDLDRAQSDAIATEGSPSTEIHWPVPIKAWVCDSAGSEQPQSVELSFASPLPRGRIQTFAVSGQWLFLATQGNGKVPDWRIWKLQPAGVGLQLVEHARLEALGNRRIEKAYLSDHGHLLAIAADADAQANKILLWVAEDVRERKRWKTVPPPDWVGTADPQRLHDWGWTPVGDERADGRHWQRNGTMIRAASFAPSGTKFATACDDGQVLLWSIANAADATHVTPLIESELQLGSSAFDVDFVNESVIVTGGRDRAARVWDVHTGAEIAPATYHGRTVHTVSVVKPNRLVTTTIRAVRIWRCNELAKAGPALTAEHIELSKTAEHLYYVGKDSIAAEFPTDTTQLSGNVHSVIVNDDGRYALAIEAKPLVGDREQEQRSVYSLMLHQPAGDGNGSRPLTLIDFSEPPQAAFSTTERRKLAVVGKPTGQSVSDKSQLKLFLFDLSANGEQTQVSDDEPIDLTDDQILNVNHIRYGTSGDDDLLVIAGDDATDAARGVVLLVMPQQGADARVRQLTTTGGSLNPHHERVLCSDFSSDEKWLATGDAHDWVYVWDVRKLIELHKQSGDNRSIVASTYFRAEHSSDVIDARFLPGESRRQRLATVSSEGEAAIWEVVEDDNVTTPQFKLQHDARIRTISFDPDGRWIITGGNDYTARIWHSGAGELVGVLRHPGPVLDARITAGDRILTICKASALRELPSAGSQTRRPLIQTQHWTIPSAGSDNRSDLSQLAARRVHDNMRLEPLADHELEPMP